MEKYVIPLVVTGVEQGTKEVIVTVAVVVPTDSIVVTDVTGPTVVVGTTIVLLVDSGEAGGVSMLVLGAIEVGIEVSTEVGIEVD